MTRPQRMHAHRSTNAIDGTVTWSPVKSLWLTSMMVVAVVGGILTFSWDAAVVSFVLTTTTLCFGHSVGLHRLLIHRSFECPLWIEHCMVYAGVLVGMGGPQKMTFMHEIRDWSQQQPDCHPFYKHQRNVLIDGIWNLHCECRLSNGPKFVPEQSLTHSEYYRLLDRYWMAAQLPVAGLLFLCGGYAYVIWGICVRVSLSLIGHWAVGFLAHNAGQTSWRVKGNGVQGFNVNGLGLLTMGEAWHNNHHAFPDSCRLGLHAGQNDPGWWLLVVLQRLGLATNLNLPHHLPELSELDRKPNEADVLHREPQVVKSQAVRQHGLRSDSGKIAQTT